MPPTPPSKPKPSKGKGKSTPSQQQQLSQQQPTSQCPPYLPPLPEIPSTTQFHAQCVSIHALTLAVNDSTDGDSFTDATLAGNLVQVIESFLRFRPHAAPTSLDRVLELLVFAWFRKLSLLLVTPAVAGRNLTNLLVPQLSMLTVLDFGRCFGHLDASSRIICALINAAPSSFQLELDDVVRLAVLFMGQWLSIHMGGGQPSLNDTSPDLYVPDPSVIVDAFVGFEAILRLTPALVSSFDDPFLSTLAAFYDTVLTESRVLDLSVRLAYSVINHRFLTAPDIHSINQLVTLLHIVVDSGQVYHSTKKIAKTFLASLALDSPLLQDLKAIDRDLFQGDVKILDYLDNLCDQYNQKGPPATSNATNDLLNDKLPPDMEVDTTVAISQVQDIFPDLPFNHVHSLLKKHANDSVLLIDALLSDPSLHVPPLPPPAPKRKTPAELELEAKALERVSEMSKLAATGEFITKRADGMEDKSEAKSMILSLANRIATEDMEEEMLYEDEYDDTYDMVDEGLSVAAGDTDLNTDELKPKIRRAEPRNAGRSDPAAEYEQQLFRAYEANPQLFNRSTKKTPERAKLRQVTGLSDEQIEGWASMLRRVPARLRHFQSKYQFAGNRSVTNPTTMSPKKDPSAPQNTFSKRGSGPTPRGNTRRPVTNPNGRPSKNPGESPNYAGGPDEEDKQKDRPQSSPRRGGGRGGRRGKVNKDGKVY